MTYPTMTTTPDKRWGDGGDYLVPGGEVAPPAAAPAPWLVDGVTVRRKSGQRPGEPAKFTLRRRPGDEGRWLIESDASGWYGSAEWIVKTFEPVSSAAESVGPKASARVEVGQWWQGCGWTGPARRVARISPDRAVFEDGAVIFLAGDGTPERPDNWTRAVDMPTGQTTRPGPAEPPSRHLECAGVPAGCGTPPRAGGTVSFGRAEVERIAAGAPSSPCGDRALSFGGHETTCVRPAGHYGCHRNGAAGLAALSWERSRVVTDGPVTAKVGSWPDASTRPAAAATPPAVRQRNRDHAAALRASPPTWALSFGCRRGEAWEVYERVLATIAEYCDARPAPLRFLDHAVVEGRALVVSWGVEPEVALADVEAAQEWLRARRGEGGR